MRGWQPGPSRTPPQCSCTILLGYPKSMAKLYFIMKSQLPVLISKVSFLKMFFFNYLGKKGREEQAFFVFIIEVYLMYNVLLVSSTENWFRYIYIYFRFFSIAGYYKILSIVPSTLFYFKWGEVVRRTLYSSKCADTSGYTEGNFNKRWKMKPTRKQNKNWFRTRIAKGGIEHKQICYIQNIPKNNLEWNLK